MFGRRLLKDKVVLVSGATQGLGAGIARAAAAEGASAVAVTGRNEQAGQSLQHELQELGCQARFYRTDLADVDQAIASVQSAVADFGALDCVVNSGGLTSRGTMLDTSPALFDQHMAINVRAPFFIMAETIRHLTGTARAGTIVNIISTAELGGAPYLAPYSVAKAGLATATRNAAHAHRWDRIRINGLDIGWTETEGEALTQRQFHGAADDWVQKANASVPMGKLGQVDEIAEFVIFLLSDRSGVVTGSVINWDQAVEGAAD